MTLGGRPSIPPSRSAFSDLKVESCPSIVAKYDEAARLGPQNCQQPGQGGDVLAVDLNQSEAALGPFAAELFIDRAMHGLDQ